MANETKTTEEKRHLPKEKAEPVTSLDTRSKSANTQTIVTATREKELARIQALDALGRQFNQQKLAERHIQEGKSIESLQAAILDQVSQKFSQNATVQVGLSDAEARRYSFTKVIRALADPGNPNLREEAAFEFEVSSAASRKLNKDPQGVLIPSDVLVRGINPLSASEQGTSLIKNELLVQSFIDILRSKAVAMNLCQTLTGLQGNIEIPRQTTEGVGYWLSKEDEDAKATDAQFDTLKLSPKTIASYTDITRKLLVQTSPDIEAMMQRELALALARQIDLSILYGTGKNGEPLGIAGTEGILTHSFTETFPAFHDLVDMESAIASENADVSSMHYLLHPKAKGFCKTTPKFPNVLGTIWEQNDTLNGYKAHVSTRVQEGDVFFGNFSDFLIGMWGGLDLTVDPYTHSTKGRLRLVVFQDVDMAVRRPQSFCYGKRGTSSLSTKGASK